MRHPVAPSDAGCVGMSSTAATSVPPTGGLTSRERVERALSHEESDRVPLDLGGSPRHRDARQLGVQLRQALGLDPPGTPVTVIEVYQMLGKIKSDLADVLAVDVASVTRLTNAYGFHNDGWKEWSAFDGIPMLVPGKFPTTREPSGDILVHPCADDSAPPSAWMPKSGFYLRCDRAPGPAR